MAYNDISAADELEEIRRNARTAQTMREGVPGSQAGAADTQQRLSNAAPTKTIRELRGELGFREPVREASPVGPRNVPLGTPGGPSPAAGAIYVGSDGTARQGINPNVPRPGASPEAQAYRSQVAADIGPPKPPASVLEAAQRAQAPVAAPPVAAPGAAAPAAAPAARPGVGGGVRALGIAGAGIGALVEGAQVKKVADDPNMTGADVATQAAEGTARLAGGTAGAIAGAKGGAALGAMTGPAAPVAVPALATIGGIAGGVAGAYGTDKIIEKGREAVNALRGSIGLDPLPTSSPASRAQPAWQGQPKAAPGTAQAAQPAAAAPPQEQKANTQGTPVAPRSSGAPSSIGQVAQQAVQPPKQRDASADMIIGETHYIHTQGGRSMVVPYGPGGMAEAVPLEVFRAGRVNDYRNAQVQAELDAYTDPRVRQQQMANEGALERQRVANEGTVAAAGVRNDKPPVDDVITDPTGKVTGKKVYRPKEGGGYSVEVEPVQPTPTAKPKTAAAAHAYAKEAVAKGWATPDTVNATLKSWGYPALTFSNK